MTPVERPPPPRPQSRRRRDEDGRRRVSTGGRPRGLVITMDGPSGTGKSTAARQLAKRLGLLYLDTGAMYRAVALEALRKGVVKQGARSIDLAPCRQALTRLAGRCRITFRKGKAGRVRVFLNGSDVTAALRRPEVSEAASRVAKLPGLRRALVRQQRAFGVRGGIVAEGRDTGTVVFPRADLKFYLTADLTERARRRHRQLREEGISIRFKEVLREVRERDLRDRSRGASPLKPAQGAIRIDNTRLKSNETLAILYDYVRRAQSDDPTRH